MERPASPQGTSLDVDELLNLAAREDPLPGWRILNPEIACDTTYYLKKEPYAPPLDNAKSKGVAYVTKFIQANATASRSIVEKGYGISVCLAALKKKRAHVSASQQSIVQLNKDEKDVVRSILKSVRAVSIYALYRGLLTAVQCHGVEAEKFWSDYEAEGLQRTTTGTTSNAKPQKANVRQKKNRKPPQSRKTSAPRSSQQSESPAALLKDTVVAKTILKDGSDGTRIGKIKKSVSFATPHSHSNEQEVIRIAFP